jgi:hypothetical protein
LKYFLLMMEHEMYDRQNTLVMYMNVLAFNCQMKTRNCVFVIKELDRPENGKAGRARTENQSAPSMNIDILVDLDLENLNGKKRQ